DPGRHQPCRRRRGRGTDGRRRERPRQALEETMATPVDTTREARNSELSASGATGLAASGALAKIGRYRWTICALLFFATTINYIDRQVIGILGPTLQRDLGWNEQQFA